MNVILHVDQYVENSLIFEAETQILKNSIKVSLECPG